MNWVFLKLPPRAFRSSSEKLPLKFLLEILAVKILLLTGNVYSPNFLHWVHYLCKDFFSISTPIWIKSLKSLFFFTEILHRTSKKSHHSSSRTASSGLICRPRSQTWKMIDILTTSPPYLSFRLIILFFIWRINLLRKVLLKLCFPAGIYINGLKNFLDNKF